MNFDAFKHRIGDHSAQEGADYLKFNQQGTQRRMAVMRGFEAYSVKKAEEGEKNVRTKDLQPSSRVTWLCRRVETHGNRKAARGGAQLRTTAGCSAGCGECRSISAMGGGGRGGPRTGAGIM